VLKGWHGWVGTFTGVVLIPVAALPLAALAVWALARRRSATGTTPARAWRMSLGEVGIVYGTVPWVWMTMLPGAQTGTVPARVDLIPLRDLLTILASGPLTATTQVGGNLVELLVQRQEADVLPLELPDDRDEVFQVAAEPVERDDGERVAGAHLVEHLGHLGPVVFSPVALSKKHLAQPAAVRAASCRARRRCQPPAVMCRQTRCGR
jgi:hypothetical protein